MSRCCIVESDLIRHAVIVVEEVLETTLAVRIEYGLRPARENVRLVAVESVAAWLIVSEVADSIDAT
jgi:hypothetical protein